MTEQVLKGAEEVAERLEVLDSMLGAYSRQFLLDIGLSEGARVLELGCGTGALTMWMARQVGPGGWVTAVDMNPRQVELARRRADAVGVTNIDFRVARVEELRLSGEPYDLAYARFLLMFLPKPKRALDLMHGALRAGGILACDEASASSHLTQPYCEVLHQLSRWTVLWAQHQGLDFDIGDKLYGLVRSYGGRVLKPRFVQPMMSIAEAKRFAELGIREIRTGLVQAGIATEQQLEQFGRALQDLADEPMAYYAFPRQAQIAAVK